MSILSRLKTWTNNTFHPLSVIARELTALRELYELDLGSRTPPIYRVTEEPGRKDTEVFYGEEAQSKAKEKLRKLFKGDNSPDEDEEEVDLTDELPL